MLSSKLNIRHAVSRQHRLAVQCQARTEATSRRALMLGSFVGMVAVAAPKALAADFKDALARKEARKARLKEAAEQIKSSGKDQQVFKKSSYSLPEEAHTPNIHTRQNEGARTQENV